MTRKIIPIVLINKLFNISIFVAHLSGDVAYRKGLSSTSVLSIEAPVPIMETLIITYNTAIPKNGIVLIKLFFIVLLFTI